MILRALVLLLSLTFAASAQTLPEPLSDGVSDFAAVLDATEEGRIGRSLQAMRDETGVHMVASTADHGGAGMRLEAYAKALFDAWGIGDGDRKDGILLLVETGDREARIALGSGYDPVYDGRAARVLSTAVLPEFREGRLAAGIEAGIASARDRLVAPFLAGRPVTVSEGFEPKRPSELVPWIMGSGAVAGLAGFFILHRRRLRRTCPRCGAQTLTRSSEVIDAPSMVSTGVGMRHVSCSACGFSDHKPYPVRYSSREARDDRDKKSHSKGGGGGDRGFGGGKSSGGGASGKW
jgi:uncharacterized protein